MTDHPDSIPSALYLGNASVVEGLLQQFVHDLASVKHVDDITRISAHMAEVFCGFDGFHVPIPDWNPLGISASAAKWMLVEPNQSSLMTYRELFRNLALKLLDIADTSADEEVAGNRTALAMKVAVGTLTGKADTLWVYGPSQFGGWIEL